MFVIKSTDIVYFRRSNTIDYNGFFNLSELITFVYNSIIYDYI